MARTNILIVEDELIIAQDISFKLEDLGYHVVAMASNYDEAIQILESSQVDVALLDIQINGEKDGIDVANYISTNMAIPFLYLTSNADFSTISRAKETQPNGYILKPIKKKELFAALEMALASKKEPENKVSADHLFVQHKDALVKIEQNEILWLSADGNYTKIFTQDQRYMVRGNIKETVKNLDNYFCRIHKSYVINLNRIDKILPMAVCINENELPIGKSFKEDFLNRIKKL